MNERKNERTNIELNERKLTTSFCLDSSKFMSTDSILHDSRTIMFLSILSTTCILIFMKRFSLTTVMCAILFLITLLRLELQDSTNPIHRCVAQET